ncbi:inner membrane protein [Polaribacter sp. KT25b]|uniref:metal-dependent hydrolase n=1 Tax=Polaribacter sp. KT25b TaxID=1855336 RepID=UPI00087C6E52|nr:metal-dependent hydrolase [Polaribacter sp. KT25b]SDS38083.1 inner membrane protein [Polaribacter sp. KT25b]
MASLIGHAFTSIALGKSFSRNRRNWKLILIAIVCAIIQDIDVIGFQFGIPYNSFWGHRGFTHSLFFALLLAILVTAIFYKKLFFSKKGIILILFFFLCGAFHSILDAFTDGGNGVAFFTPFNNTRYFFPWRPIKASPLGITRFFSERGMLVIRSEVTWIVLPGFIYMVIAFLIRKKRNKI